MDIENLIGSYAFPIVMCIWFMFRTEKVIQANTVATENLGKLIIEHFKKH